MDSLEISSIDHDIRHKLGWIEVYVRLKVNGSRLPYILDVNTFLSAIEASGKQPIFTCECGHFGCGGYFIDVEVTEDAWILKNRYDPLDENVLLEAVEYRIPWHQVKQLVVQICEQLQTIKAQAPDFPLHWGVVGNATDTMPSPQEVEGAVAAIDKRLNSLANG
jgi:hypothetical protein